MSVGEVLIILVICGGSVEGGSTGSNSCSAKFFGSAVLYKPFIVFWCVHSVLLFACLYELRTFMTNTAQHIIWAPSVH